MIHIISLMMKHGPRIFSTTHIKQWIISELDQLTMDDEKTLQDLDHNQQKIPYGFKQNTLHTKTLTLEKDEGYRDMTGRYDKSRLFESRKEDLDGLLTNGTLVSV